MTVKVRSKENKKGNSIYLDTYYAINNRKTETIFSCISKNDLNKYLKLASKEAKIREERHKFINRSYSCDINNLNVANYLSLFATMYSKKDINKVNATVKKFCEFQINFFEEITFQNFNQNVLEQFADFLSNNLNGETPKSYFKCFVRILKEFHKRNMLDINTFNMDKIKFSSKKNKYVKQILSNEELKLIRDSISDYNEIKKAFLFACFSGLGLAECRILDWDMISDENVLRVKRCKNDEIIDVKLNSVIVDLLGTRQKEGKVFNLISTKSKGGYLTGATINKYLKNIMVELGIKKHITFYCGRHTFADLLLSKGLDNKSDDFQKFVLTKALGHANINSSLPYLNNYHGSLYKITESLTF